jgi:hypothetical protein
MRYFITRQNTQKTREVDQTLAVKFIYDIHPGFRIPRRELEETIMRSLTHPATNKNGDFLEVLPGTPR